VVLDGWGWPWAFYANVPVAAVSAAIVVCAMPAGAGALRRPSVDVLVEAVTLLVAAAALLGGLSLAAAHGAAWLLLSATAALPTAVWARSGPGRRAVRRLAVPAVRQPHVSLLLESFAFGAATFALPFLLAAGTLDSARSVALTLLALPAAAIVGSAFGGVLADRVQARLTAIVGTATLALGIATLASADASWGPSALLAGIALAGLGAGGFSGANQTIAMTAAGPGDAAGTGASTTIARQLGFAAGPATVTFIWALHDFALAGLSAALLLAGVASAAAAAVLVPVPAPPNADVHLDERKIS
jgi:predicted MFS family arabinose efflux permease